MRAFQFDASNERVEELSHVAETLDHEANQRTVFSLVDVELSEDERTSLQEASQSTYMPSTSSWVGLEVEDNKGGGSKYSRLDIPLTYLRQSCAQTLGKALLDLSISPDGYMMRIDQNSLCQGVLCAATQPLHLLLGRILNEVNSFELEARMVDELTRTGDFLWDAMFEFKPNRAFFRRFYDLDKYLARLQTADKFADTALGVLMLINSEFRDIVTQSSRHIPALKGSTVDLTFGDPPALELPTVMGVVRKFPVELGAMFPGEVLGAQTTKVKYSDVMFAALRACLRSAILKTSINSTPLYDRWLRMGEIIQVG